MKMKGEKFQHKILGWEGERENERKERVRWVSPPSSLLITETQHRTDGIGCHRKRAQCIKQSPSFRDVFLLNKSLRLSQRIKQT